jgi:hypothetical protein
LMSQRGYRLINLREARAEISLQGAGMCGSSTVKSTARTLPAITGEFSMRQGGTGKTICVVSALQHAHAYRYYLNPRTSV